MDDYSPNMSIFIRIHPYCIIYYVSCWSVWKIHSMSNDHYHLLLLRIALNGFNMCNLSNLVSSITILVVCDPDSDLHSKVSKKFHDPDSNTNSSSMLFRFSFIF